MLDKKANFRQRMAELKGITDLVSDEIKPTPSEEKLKKMRALVQQEADKTKEPFQKQASSNMLDVFANLVSIVKHRLEVDETKARELTSIIISKSIPIQKQYNLSLTEASSKILEEMEKQLGKGQVKVDKGFVGYQRQDAEIYGPVQMKIKESFNLTQGDSEMYTKMVKDVVRDFSIQFRGVSEDAIANAIVDVAAKNGDITTISGIKNSSFLENALRMELGLC